MIKMKSSYATLNIPKWKVTFPRPISTPAQIHEMLPEGAPPTAIRIAMDLDRARREWADSSRVVESAKKYVQLFDQFKSWLSRNEYRTRDATFLWRDSEGHIIASTDENFEHMMNNHAMGLMCAWTGDLKSADEHFKIAEECVFPVIPGERYAQYARTSLPKVRKVCTLGVGLLCTMESAQEREALALELLDATPTFPRTSAWGPYSTQVKRTLLEHAMRARMHILVEEDNFADAHVFASILNDEGACKFLESMALTARQSLKDVDEFLNSLEVAPEVTPTVVTSAPTYLGFDALK